VQTTGVGTIHPMAADPTHETLAGELADLRTVMLIGAMDTGKTTFARRLAQAALAGGRRVAFVDADIGNSTVGPPTCVGLRLLDPAEPDAALERADALHFVGAVTPDRHILQQVIATAALAERGREAADLVVIDTSASVSGVIGETLKYHKMELCRPDRVVALQRGSELEPLVGMLRRFFSAEVTVLTTEPGIATVGPVERSAQRTAKLKEAFAEPLERWRVRPTVFAPTLPAGLDLGRLDGMLVGIQDGDGHCLGLGRLEYDDGILRVLTNAGEGMQGLRLGSVRIDPDGFECRPVNLRELIFGV